MLVHVIPPTHCGKTWPLGYKPKVSQLSRTAAKTNMGAAGLADQCGHGQTSVGHKAVCETGSPWKGE